MDFQLKRLWVKRNKKDKQIWETLLLQAGIRAEKNVDYTVGLFDEEKLIAVGSLSRNVLKCIAVCEKYTGGEAISQLISHLMSMVFDSGETACYVYTKPCAKKSFIHLGFKEIARVSNELVFMEKAAFGFPHFIEKLGTQRKDGNSIAGIVINANPFTRGHLHLIETAAKESDVVHLFVLSEDASVFPAKDRLELVKEGVRHLKNIFVHETGNYMISSATFPSYFLKEESDVIKIHAMLDAIIFKEWIAPALNITLRYVGEEPYSEVTNIYNRTMAEIFNNNIKLVILPRKTEQGEIISASRVRYLLSQNGLDKIKALVPETTFKYLQSPKGKAIQQKIKKE
ncbi:[citrate (pro-3S)-lyase] ligase [Schnuerera sp. xch1]|uniref:[citrate (pro-3S)-lyase] ligase n=1 Tax=Schnuerera sp. xch1 TaxID=2874283 RepID=UPI001CBAE147|nr:[citrate (pro-3S)-lyase] ligase [Schnuerera sp. xch1]MBZ2175045.1 [citrate (pro-3S)-lyase] ligase [Schnuerera sp. xch1]